MSFTSFSFLCFFALCLVGFFALPQRLRPWLLLAASLGFYAAAGLPAMGWLFATAAVSWGAGRCISAGRHPGAACAGAVVCHLGLLFALKYLNFFAGREILTLAIPAGLSFFTFMAVSYVTDVRRGICPAEKNFGRYLLYLSFFPHVLQGPIDRYAGLTPGLFAGAGFEERRFLRGAWRMLWGFFEKLVIADRLGILVAAVWKEPEAYAGWRVAAAVVCYALQIYADFAGYMDVALGAGEIFGITLAENFDTPYFSRSVPEFWRRWHITLGAWFRDYLFYPLQRTGAFRRLGKFLKGKFGKQAAKNLPAALALAAVWLFTGLWHGARLTYVAWGAYYGLLIILSMLCEPLCARLRPQKKSLLFEAFRLGRTFAAVCLGYVLFRSASMGEAWRVLVRIFTAPFAAGKGFSSAGLGMADYAVLAFALGLRLLVSLCRVKGVDLREKLLALPLPLRWGAALALIFSVILFGIYGPGYDAASFIYFEF